ncbi:MAG: hypothetical protein OHK0050_22710 [Roseiflexaceae bacterium]
MPLVIDGVEYLDGDEVAALLQVKKATLYAYVSRGALESFRQGVGRRRLYRRDQVEALRSVRPDRGAARDPGLREESPPYVWQGFPDEEQPRGSADLPDVSSWAGDH